MYVVVCLDVVFLFCFWGWGVKGSVSVYPLSAYSFRKQSQLEKKSVRKQYKSKLKTEGALLRQSDIMARGLQAYLGKLDRQKEKYVQTHNARRESIKQKHGALLQSTFSHITQPRVSFCF